MSKKVTISLSGIVKEIDKATGQLSAAKRKAAARREKQSLAVNIKKLKKIRYEVQMRCRGLTIAVLTK